MPTGNINESKNNNKKGFFKLKWLSTIKQIAAKMSASVETKKASKDEKRTNEDAVTIQTPTPTEGEEGKETNTRK